MNELRKINKSSKAYTSINSALDMCTAFLDVVADIFALANAD